MNGIDLSAVWARFAGLPLAERIELAGQVADQLNAILVAADSQDVGMSAVWRAQVTGALVALKAVAGR